MTRVNVVPVEELVNKHLVAEYREITRVFTQRRNAIASRRIIKVPSEYTMGTGHVSFFTNKLQFVLDRYHSLTKEMLRRGFNAVPVADELLLEGIDKRWMNNYSVTVEALRINRARIEERLSGEKK